MRPFLWWMKHLRIHSIGPAFRLLRVSRSCFHTLSIWLDPLFLLRGVSMGTVHRRQMVTMERLSDGLGRGLRGQTSVRSLDGRILLLAHKQPGAESRLSGNDTLSPLTQGVSRDCQDRQHGGGISCKPPSGFTVPLRSGGCMLNRQTVAQIWDLFGRAEMDLFASQDLSQCPLCFSPSSPASLGIEAFAHPWPDLKLYAFLPVKLNSGSAVQGEGEWGPSPTRSPVLALKLYVDHSSHWRKFPQLLTCFVAGRRGLPASKHRISHWVRDAISVAYEVRGLSSPLSVRGEFCQECGFLSSTFWRSPLEDICVAAGRSSPHTFIKFYNLDLDTAPGSRPLEPAVNTIWFIIGPDTAAL